MKSISFICAVPPAFRTGQHLKSLADACAAIRADRGPIRCVRYLNESVAEAAAELANVASVGVGRVSYASLLNLESARDIVFRLESSGDLALYLLDFAPGTSPKEVGGTLIVAPQHDIVQIGRTLFQLDEDATGEVKDDAVRPADCFTASLHMGSLGQRDRIQLRRYRPSEKRWQRLATVRLPLWAERQRQLAAALT